MTGTGADELRRPRFSIVTAVYDVEPYLPDFINSIERLRVAAGDLEIVAVDDGSTDASLDVLREWAGKSRHRVKVFTKPNGGQGSARNLGLEHATGDWVTFPDPDDVVEKDYLRAADRFAQRNPEIEVMSARPVIVRESSGSEKRPHPRDWQYAAGSRPADLTIESSVFLGVSSGSFFSLDRIRAANLEFDTRIRPNFEDGHFAARYLLELSRPVVGLLRDSVYVYRKRAAGTSSLQRSMRDPGRYSDVLELGYLDIIERARRPDGSVPAWIQQLIVYELSWYLSEDERISTTVRVPPDLMRRFHELVDRLLRALDPEVVGRHRGRRLSSVWRDLLARAGRGSDWHSPVIVHSQRDRAMGLRRFQYRYVGRPPGETILAGGRAIQPAFQKTMAHRYFERDFLWERILWLPDVADLTIALDGASMPQSRSWPTPPSEARPERGTGGGERLWRLRRQGVRGATVAITRRARRLLRHAVAAPLRFAARSWPHRARFRNAWVVMDRIHDADDNGERLFEYLRAQRPDINAWFVIAGDTPDAKRLREAGADRLVEWGSMRWKLLMWNAAWLVSSHADAAIVDPPGLRQIVGSRRWRFAFLQHGVIKDDLSRWLNHRAIDCFVVSTDAELTSVAGDGTTYVVTHKEARNTGLPRFDRLLAKGRAVAPAGRDLVIIAPTWREWLTTPLAAGSQRRALDPLFWESDYLRNWTELLRSRTIADSASSRGLRLAFMPHPNLQSMLHELDLPDHVEPLAFTNVDVQGLYARCALLVTDYSSVAFNLAYIDRPVVYFQFDRDAVLGGLHVGRKGYFDYERDGFGPVAEDLQAAEVAIIAAIEDGPQPARVYRQRISSTFPIRDGQACARVVAAIEEMSRPWAGDRPTPARRRNR